MLQFSFILFLTNVYFISGQQKTYDGWTLVKVNPANDVQVKFLSNLRQNLNDLEFQVWQEGGLTRPFDIAVSPEAKTPLLSKLNELNIPFLVKSDNIQQAINSEKKSVPSRARSLSGVGNAVWFRKFMKLNEINNAIQQLAKTNPQLVKIETIGKSALRKPISLVRISSPNNATAKKPGIWIDGGIHAREWASPATVLYILNKLVTGYNSDPAIKNYIDKANFYIVTVLNPDGYDYTHTMDRMWRKNRRPINGQCVGVDLNRNFDFGFGGAGTSDDPCEEIYRGPSAFSEPESQAVRDYLLGHKDILAYLTIHSYSQMWFYPFGHLKGFYPPDVNELANVANLGAKKLAALYGTHYDVGTAADLLYEAAGGSDDWAKGKAGIKYVYTLEVRPNGDDPNRNGFILSPSEIVPMGEETYAGLSAVFDAVIGSKSI